MKPKHLALASSAALLTLILPATAQATLIMEPVLNRVAGSGPGEALLGLHSLDLINPATGQPFLTADEPGEIVTYPAGFPADPVLVNTVRIFNNTAFDITGLTLTIVGTADEPEPFNFTIQRDPNVDAFFGDANGDGDIGESDIFGTVTLSNDGRTITFTDGLIPVGGRFTDFLFSMTTDGLPFKAAVDASFAGVRAVPEPVAIGLMGLGVLCVAAVRRRKSS